MRDGDVIATANKARDGFGRNFDTAASASSGISVISAMEWSPLSLVAVAIGGGFGHGACVSTTGYRYR